MDQKTTQQAVARFDSLPPDYSELLESLKRQIRDTQIQVSASVNRELVVLYWHIGKEVASRIGQEGWGKKVIERLSNDLRTEFPESTGLSVRNILYMKQLAEAYPHERIVQQLVALIPWGHNVRILDYVKDPETREFYIRQTIKNGWSRNVLVHQIESGLHLRQGQIQTNFEATLPAPQSDLAREVLKDPYIFDFLSLGPEHSERELETALIERIRDTLIELGRGFAFVGSQYHLEIGEQDYYIDLLFYHLHLRRYVVIELKAGEFKPEYAGKLNFYLSAVDDMIKHEQDESTIGLILCKSKNKITVEYALRDLRKPMGVAAYKLLSELPESLQHELPDAEEIASRLKLNER